MKSKVTRSLSAGCALLGMAAATYAGEYLVGDFHQHTLYTDGGIPFHDVMAVNDAYGLDWWANSEHGGERNRDGVGAKWGDTNAYPVNPIMGWYEESGGWQEMWRWQSLRDYVWPDILTARADYPNKTLISGFEWNVPGHEHCSIGVIAENNEAISAFEYMFDASDEDNSREGEMTSFGVLTKQNGLYDFVQNSTSVGSTGKSVEERHADSVTACVWMQDQYLKGLIDNAWIVFGHIERKGEWTAERGFRGYNIEHFRDYNNAAPLVCFGYEGAPGHQTSGDRGFGRSATGGGTYGGSGYYSGIVGGMWDALLGEGRGWWNFASSDFHWHWAFGGSDFWPGEYQKNYTYIDTENPNLESAIADGLRSGNSYHVMGDLIDSLEFSAHGQGKFKAQMGETLCVKKGRMVQLKIKVRDPKSANHCPLDMNNPSLEQIGIEVPLNMPVLDHIDLIGGDVTGMINPEHPAYTNATNPSAAVVATFAPTCDIEEDGTMTFVYTFKAQKDQYFRLRGSNLPAGVPFETDEMGNPLADAEANDNLYSLMDAEELESKLFAGVEIGTNSKLDAVAEAYADLWFYSNPIFVKVVD